MEENIFDKNYKIYLIGFFIIAALPFINFQPWLSPPAWGKAIIFRIIVSFFIYFFFYQIIKEKKYSLFKELIKNKIVLLLLILALLYILSTIFSQNAHFSFWGSPLRSGGSLNYLLFIVFAILAFLIIKKQDWQKLWDFSFIIGLLITLVAIFQKLNIFHGFIIPRTDRAIGTIGGAPFFALYLCLLVFMALSFAINAKGKKRYFYLLSFIFFVLGIILSGSKGAILALGISLLLYALFFPSRKRRLFRIICAAGLILLLALILFGLSKSPQLVKKIEGNNVIGNSFHRIWYQFQTIKQIQNLSLGEAGAAIFQDRFSSWTISLKALREKPLLGFGPENFSIVFDKYYNASLAGYSGEEWWDRAHNFILDTSTTAGIPALIVFLALFGVLFYKLQKDKNLIKHGLQVTLFAYLVNNLFNFDVFSNSLLLFFIIGYTLHLTSQKPDTSTEKINKNENPFRAIAFTIAFILLLSFIWFGALKPLWINKEINVANSYLQQGKKEAAIEKMESILTKNSVIKNYTLLQYVEILNISMNMPPLPTPETRVMMTNKAANALKESITLRPNYTRSWWALNIYANYLIGILKNPPQELKNESVDFCEKAYQLSPGHWKISKDCTSTYLLIGEAEKAKQKADDCIKAKPEVGLCWFRKTLANIALEELEEAEENLSEAEKRGYPRIIDYSEFSQLARSYNIQLKKTTDLDVKNYLNEKLVEVYKKLAENYLKSEGKEYPQTLEDFLKNI